MIHDEIDPTVCGETEDMAQAFKSVMDLNPDMAIVDITLKGSNGIKLIKRIKNYKKNSPSLSIPCMPKHYTPNAI